MSIKKYRVKHNFMFNGGFKEAGMTLEAEPFEVRYLVLGGQLEEQLPKVEPNEPLPEETQALSQQPKKRRRK